jgi:hypothetical protein
MRHLQTNARLEAVHGAGGGLIVNDFTSGSAAAGNKRLHLAPAVRSGAGAAYPAKERLR